MCVLCKAVIVQRISKARSAIFLILNDSRAVLSSLQLLITISCNRKHPIACTTGCWKFIASPFLLDSWRIGLAVRVFGSNPVAVVMSLYAAPICHALTPPSTLVEKITQV